MGKKRIARNPEMKEHEASDNKSEGLKIKWKDLLVTIKSSRPLKSGRWYLYSAAIADMLGVITIVITSLKDTCWVWVVTSFAFLLLLSVSFIAGVIVIALLMTQQEQ